MRDLISVDLYSLVTKVLSLTPFYERCKENYEMSCVLLHRYIYTFMQPDTLVFCKQGQDTFALNAEEVYL